VDRAASVRTQYGRAVQPRTPADCVQKVRGKAEMQHPFDEHAAENRRRVRIPLRYQ
jgi:hypothetical protein